MNSGNESLQRVLKEIKGAARKMRVGKYTDRLSPKKEAPMGEALQEMGEKPVEEVEKVTVLAGPTEDDGEEEGTEEETDEAKLAAEIKKLLARV